MIHVERTATIQASPDAVWEVLGRYMHIDEFAPGVTRVDALTNGSVGKGAQRRCHFDNGNAMVEEVTEWAPGKGYSVRGSELDPMPLTSMRASIQIEPVTDANCKVIWSADFDVKFGPLGWLLGQLMMKPMMGKVITANLDGLAAKVS